MTFVAALALVAAFAGAASEERAALVEGVKEIASPGVPGPLCVTGRDAFAVIAGRSEGGTRAAVVAAASFGKGRVVVFGHDGYFSGAALRQANTQKLFENAVRWTTRGRKSPRIALRGPGMGEYLRGIGYDAAAAQDPDWFVGASMADVICVETARLTDEDVKIVTEYVRNGGGLIAASLGWGWLQLNPGKSIRQHPGNRLLAPMGILWADGMLEPTGKNGFTTAEPANGCHAGDAVEALEATTRGTVQADFRQAGAMAMAAMLTLPTDDATLRPRLQSLVGRHEVKWVDASGNAVPVRGALDRLAVVAQYEDVSGAAPDRVRAHPSAVAFPGAVPADAPRVERSIRVFAGRDGWQGTGLYAAPGDLVTVKTPEGLWKTGATLRIGAHTDTLWHLPQWERAPDISRSYPLTGTETRVASPFGGAIFVEAAAGAVAEHDVTIRGAVEAPRFIRGRTTLAEWRSRLRSHPAPWAELEGNDVILTVPSEAVRTLEDPESLMAFWDDAMDRVAYLAGFPGSLPRPERFVADRQISAGYMHSGYPIMTGLDVAPLVVDLPRLRTEGSWGHFHEAGHNYQAEDWTFEGTVEVTNNLFSVYLYERLCGVYVKPHPALEPKSMESRMAGHIAGGADFRRWQDDPFLALTMYLQLRDAFGWEPFRQVFAEYRGLDRSARPRDDAQKRDQWMVRFSRAVGRNLGPFFVAWGVPTSESARRSLDELPPWMPPGFPPAGGKQE